MTDKSIVTCLCGREFKGDNGAGISHRDEEAPFICPCGLRLFYDQDQWKAKSTEGRRTSAVISLEKLNEEKGNGK